MHIALETPKGNKIKCGFIDALLSWLISNTQKALKTMPK
jgi:hypothetical protein